MTDDAEPTELPTIFIRERMKAAKPRITAKVLAERMQTSEAQISRLLGGQRRMTLEWLNSFAGAMGVPITQLFTPPGAEKEATTAKARTEAEVKELLARIDMKPGAIDPVWGLITFYLKSGEQPESSPARDQSGDATRPRGSAPSQQQPVRSDA